MMIHTELHMVDSPTHFVYSKKESKQSSISVHECLKYKTTVSTGNVTPNADEISLKMS